MRDFPDSSWSEEALNNLGTYYILEERRRDGGARPSIELFEKFPERPARRARRVEVGMVGLQERRLRRDGARLRDRGRGRFRGPTTARSFLYWAARSHGKLGAGADAESRLRLVVTDYGNSYYGRLAGRHLSAQRADGADRRRRSGGAPVGGRPAGRAAERRP